MKVYGNGGQIRNLNHFVFAITHFYPMTINNLIPSSSFKATTSLLDFSVVFLVIVLALSVDGTKEAAGPVAKKPIE